MKQRIVVVLALVGALLTLNVAFGENLPKPDQRFTAKNLRLIEKNIDIGLDKTTCPGLQESAAAVLRQVESYAPDYSYRSSLIPLMALLNDHQENPSARILAAVALHNLNSTEGNHVIRMTGRYSGQPLVRKLCAALASDPPPAAPKTVVSLVKTELAVKSLHQEDPRFTVENLRIIEKNIVDELNFRGDNTLQTSAAKTLYEIECYAPAFRFSSAIIPLMAIVKSHDQPVTTRIWAARALHAIHSARGDFALAMMAKFSNQSRVRKFCATLSAIRRS
jgi:hypothetical protein